MKSKPEVPRGRDLRFDTLRGLLLVCMTVNHLPTELRRVTDQSLGVFSAAEGFVFLSGLMAGWIYTRRLRRDGPEGLWNAAMARSKSIYLWHVGSFLAAFLCVQLTGRLLGFCSTTSPRLFVEHPFTSLGLGFSLLYQPGLLDLLPMYCAFVLLLPAVLRALEAGKRWLVLGLSTLVWAAVQVAPQGASAPLYFINTGIFNLFAWQLLFVAGIALGHARATPGPHVTRPNRWVVAAAAALALYCVCLQKAHWAPLWPDRLYGVLLNKPALGLLRMADFGCVAYLVSLVGARFPALLSWRPLALLGRHSLLVVATQSVLVVTLLQFAPLFASALTRSLTAVATVGVLFGAAWVRDRMTRRAPVPPAPTPVRVLRARAHALAPA